MLQHACAIVELVLFEQHAGKLLKQPCHHRMAFAHSRRPHRQLPHQQMFSSSKFILTLKLACHASQQWPRVRMVVPVYGKMKFKG
jgi:hypothetical protein